MKLGNNLVKKVYCNVYVNKFVWDGCIIRYKKNFLENRLFLNFVFKEFI